LTAKKLWSWWLKNAQTKIRSTVLWEVDPLVDHHHDSPEATHDAMPGRTEAETETESEAETEIEVETETETETADVDNCCRILLVFWYSSLSCHTTARRACAKRDLKYRCIINNVTYRCVINDVMINLYNPIIIQRQTN